MRYRKAPILEAAFEVRWSAPKSLEALKETLATPAFEEFADPKPRIQFGTSFKVGLNQIEHEQEQIGYEINSQDGSKVVLLENGRFVFIQRAPYDRWESFIGHGKALLDSTVEKLEISTFQRVGLRFVNRIDIPDPNGGGVKTEDYIRYSFDGPRRDLGVIQEFQMRVVKPSERDGLQYALVLATTISPMPNFASILVDIDVFTTQETAAHADEFDALLSEMRAEKNEIFRDCLTDNARELFGGVEE